MTWLAEDKKFDKIWGDLNHFKKKGKGLYENFRYFSVGFEPTTFKFWTVQRKKGFTSWSKVTYNKNLKIFPITPSTPHWTPPINSQKLSQKFKKYWYKINCVNQQVKSAIRKSKKRAKKRVSLAHRHSSSLCTVMIRNWRGFRDLYFLNLPWTCLASILLLGPRRTASKHSMFLRHVSTISSWIFSRKERKI